MRRPKVRIGTLMLLVVIAAVYLGYVRLAHAMVIAPGGELDSGSPSTIDLAVRMTVLLAIPPVVMLASIPIRHVARRARERATS